jgi:hypothetical protein
MAGAVDGAIPAAEAGRDIAARAATAIVDRSVTKGFLVFMCTPAGRSYGIFPADRGDSPALVARGRRSRARHAGGRAHPCPGRAAPLGNPAALSGFLDRSRPEALRPRLATGVLFDVAFLEPRPRKIRVATGGRVSSTKLRAVADG